MNKDLDILKAILSEAEGDEVKAAKDKEKEVMPKKRLTSAQKYSQLKRQTESAGMKVSEKNGKIVVSRRKKK